MVASLSHPKEIAQLLIAQGADVNAKNADGETPLDVAKWAGKEMAKLLIAKGATVSTLHTAVYVGNFDKVKSLIVKYSDATAKDKSGRTPLFYAENKQIAEFLITKGVDVNARAEDGSTIPLPLWLLPILWLSEGGKLASGRMCYKSCEVKTKELRSRVSAYLARC